MAKCLKQIMALLCAASMLLWVMGCQSAPDDAPTPPQDTAADPVADTTPLTPAEGGSASGETTDVPDGEGDTVPEGQTPTVEDAIQNEAATLPEYVPEPHGNTAIASGVKTESNDEAIIDYSNTADGYVMVQYTAQTDSKLKAQVKGPSTTYTYHLKPGRWTSFPLSDESGTYQIIVYKNVVDSKYATVLSVTTEVYLTDEFAPFLHSNQFVSFDNAPNAVAKADVLCHGLSTLEQVAAVYDFVVKNMTYDTYQAANVKSGYTPVLDDVMARMTGICFDYAALMTGMLRSQGVPCKLVVGYAGDVYHAWINVWSENTGWVEGAIFFDGSSWQRMDPTFASSANGDSSILEYIGNGSNYSAKYIY